MNPFLFKDDDDDDELNQKFINLFALDPKDNKQPQKRSHTTISNQNMDNFKDNQEHQQFKQNMKQCQQIFQRKLEKHKDSNKQQHQDQNFQNQQNQQKLVCFPSPPLSNNKQKQQLIPPLIFNKLNQQNEKLKYNQLKNKIKIEEVQENFTQTNIIKLDSCSACLQPKQADHQCDDEYGLIVCPYCSDHIVRNFLNDHLVDCISYIEHQFQSLEQLKECCICMENLITDQQTFDCDHSFHKSCIDSWMMKKKECPVCRKPI